MPRDGLLAGVALEKPAEHIGCVPIRLGNEVRVHIQRRGRVAVAEAAGDGAHVVPSGQQSGGDVVTQIVEADIVEADRVARRTESSRDGVGKPRLGTINGTAEHERLLTDRGLADGRPFVDPLAVGNHLADGDGVEGDPPRLVCLRAFLDESVGTMTIPRLIVTTPTPRSGRPTAVRAFHFVALRSSPPA